MKSHRADDPPAESIEGWIGDGEKTMPKRESMTQGGAPLDANMIAEVLGSLEEMNVEDISLGPKLAGGIMSDAALIIRALTEKAGVKIS